MSCRRSTTPDRNARLMPGVLSGRRFSLVSAWLDSLIPQPPGDDAHVVLQGHITRKLGDEKYEFKDSTGTITVEIDDEDLPPVAFDDKTRVKLTGKVDKGLLQREVDVDRLEITQ